MTDIELKPGWWKQPSPFTQTGAWQAEDEDYPGDYSAQPKTGQPVVIKCGATGCEKTLTVDASVTLKTTYSCREHTEQAPDDVRFQEFQHDKQLDGE